MDINLTPESKKFVEDHKISLYALGGIGLAGITYLIVRSIWKGNLKKETMIGIGSKGIIALATSNKANEMLKKADFLKKIVNVK